jgi:hypothetical protein
MAITVEVTAPVEPTPDFASRRFRPLGQRLVAHRVRPYARQRLIQEGSRHGGGPWSCAQSEAYRPTFGAGQPASLRGEPGGEFAEVEASGRGPPPFRFLELVPEAARAGLVDGWETIALCGRPGPRPVGMEQPQAPLPSIARHGLNDRVRAGQFEDHGQFRFVPPVRNRTLPLGDCLPLRFTRLAVALGETGNVVIPASHRHEVALVGGDATRCGAIGTLLGNDHQGRTGNRGHHSATGSDGREPRSGNPSGRDHGHEPIETVSGKRPGRIHSLEAGADVDGGETLRGDLRQVGIHIDRQDGFSGASAAT